MRKAESIEPTQTLLLFHGLSPCREGSGIAGRRKVLCRPGQHPLRRVSIRAEGSPGEAASGHGVRRCRACRSGTWPCRCGASSRSRRRRARRRRCRPARWPPVLWLSRLRPSRWLAGSAPAREAGRLLAVDDVVEELAAAFANSAVQDVLACFAHGRLHVMVGLNVWNASGRGCARSLLVGPAVAGELAEQVGRHGRERRDRREDRGAGLSTSQKPVPIHSAS